MTPAKQLKGLTLDGGWQVVDAASKKPNATGGHFSHGYIVEHPDGTKGFLKALDYATAFFSPTPAIVLQSMTSAYNFEKSICDKTAHLSRVVRAVDSGKVYLNPKDPSTVVEYLIFELASGDIRAHLDAQGTMDTRFLLRTLHHVATGLERLLNNCYWAGLSMALGCAAWTGSPTRRT